MVNMTRSFSCELQDREGPGSQGRGSVPLEYSGSAPHFPGAPALRDLLQGRRNLLRPQCRVPCVMPWLSGTPACSSERARRLVLGVLRVQGCGVSQREPMEGRDGGTGSPHPSCSIHPSIR